VRLHVRQHAHQHAFWQCALALAALAHNGILCCGTLFQQARFLRSDGLLLQLGSSRTRDATHCSSLFRELLSICSRCHCSLLLFGCRLLQPGQLLCLLLRIILRLLVFPLSRSRMLPHSRAVLVHEQQ